MDFVLTKVQVDKIGLNAFIQYLVFSIDVKLVFGYHHQTRWQHYNLNNDDFQYQASDNNGNKSNLGTISIVVGSTPSPNGSLEILSHSSYIDSVGYLHVVGEVDNNSSKTAKFVEIIGTFYDGNGHVVGTQNAFTDPSDLAPGEKAPFDLVLTSASISIDQIKSYRLQLNSS